MPLPLLLFFSALALGGCSEQKNYPPDIPETGNITVHEDAAEMIVSVQGFIVRPDLYYEAAWTELSIKFQNNVAGEPCLEHRYALKDKQVEEGEVGNHYFFDDYIANIRPEAAATHMDRYQGFLDGKYEGSTIAFGGGFECDEDLAERYSEELEKIKQAYQKQYSP